MAAISSNGTGGGAWSAGATWAGGVVPGASGVDSVTIVAGDTVSLDITTHVNSVTTVVIEAGAKLTIDAAFATDAKFTGNWTVQGEVEFKKTSGTWELRIQGEFSVKTGGTLDMDASAAGCKQILSSDSTADNAAFLDCESGSTIYLKGRTKTHRSILNGALTADVTTGLAVDDDTGWEAGDVVVLIDEAGTIEELTLGTKSGTWPFTGGGAGGNTPVYSHLDNSEVWNLTRSCVIKSSDAANSASFDILAGTTVSAFEYVEFYHGDEVTLPTTASITVTGSVAWGWESAKSGWHVYHGQTLTNCIAYTPVANRGSNDTAFLIGGDNSTLDGCCGTGTQGLQIFYGQNGLIMDCVFGGCTAAAPVWFRNPSRFTFIGGYYWGTSQACSVPYFDTFHSVTFSKDPGGNSRLPASNPERHVYIYHNTVWFDECDFNGYVPSPVSGFGSYISVQDGGTSGKRVQGQKYGTIESNTVEARGGSGFCDALDSSSVVSHLRYRIQFPVASGKTPSLTFWAKDDGGANDLGEIIVVLGGYRCGLTAIASGTPITLTNTYAQKTITFTGTTNRAGMVEVLIDVYDSTPGGAVMYVDDIAVTGNL